MGFWGFGGTWRSCTPSRRRARSPGGSPPRSRPGRSGSRRRGDQQDMRAVDVRDDEAARRKAGRAEVRLGGEVDDRLAAVRGAGGRNRVCHVALHELVHASSRARLPKSVSRSSTTASSPAATRRFTKSLPRKPAPPGTRTRTPRP